MPDVNLPLSGAVTQAFEPWTALWNMAGGQVGLVNVNLGKSADPEAEAELISDVASYGRQLGRSEDYLIALLRDFAPKELSPEERKAVADLRRMLDDIADVRDRRSGKAGLRP